MNEVDVCWPESNNTVLERNRRIEELESINATLLLRSSSAMRQFGEMLVRCGNLEGKLGMEMMRRIVLEREGHAKSEERIKQ